MSMMIDRLVKRTVLVCAVLATLAFGVNHHDHPCTGQQVGAGGMCVSTAWTGGAA
ncbi:hypothetical protein [Micromonospora sp. WMMD980]|uniref:hypothetical protein n=1 Tax=Micromonospora sp. WMMD980 TaxID=3016088 RepID=UPI002415E1AE|nr:hypothetical protein [Micromonospora sp. WMMD980]MDG4798992.1 hypothetical protein [Micromonospora sp. WMMD980]MDG4799004.1 hypothetical protein [Micromonospora sp. WMMD980]MDG4799070.1 hypothetical protein [Micromonospora sp. WMMD980]